MFISGQFEVQLEPQQDEATPAGRMLIHKTYHGALSGLGLGQMISKRVPQGDAVYYAIEEFTGAVEGKKGGFTLLHRGEMSASAQSLEIRILEGSGTGALKGISGTMNIVQEGGAHRYELNYQL